MGGHHDDESSGLVNIAIATIFAREFLEGAIIIGQYRTVINKSEWDDERKKEALKNVTVSATLASVVAVLVAVVFGVSLWALGRDMDEKVVEVIEGVSKIVAAICIVQLSVKIPGWLGIYWKVSVLPWKQNKEVKSPDEFTLTTNEIRFNVAWNIWREVAECGVFLIPFFLGSKADQIPVSAVIGVAISAVLGAGIYIANRKLENKFWLAFFMSGLTLMLAVGLFTGGCHEFEEVYGYTKRVWGLRGEFWYHGNFPMVILKPFGYSSARTILQMVCFWGCLLVGLTLHYLKWSATQVAKANHAAQAQDDQDAPKKDVELGDSTAKGASDSSDKPDEESEEGNA